MAKWLNYASSLLDDLDSSAKEHIAKEGTVESAIERRARRRRQQELALSESGEADRIPSTEGKSDSPDTSRGEPVTRREDQAEGETSLNEAAGGEVVSEVPSGGDLDGLRPEQDSAREAAQSDAESTVTEVPRSSGAVALRSRSPMKKGKSQAAKLPTKSWIRLRNLDANTKPSLLLAALTEAEETLAAQTMEMEQVCLELEREEERRKDLEEDLKAAGEALAHATRKAIARESELRDTVADLKRSRVDADKSARLSITSAQKEADQARTTLKVKNTEIERLTDALATAERDKNDAEETVAELRTMGSQGLQGVKAEVRVLENRIEEMEEQHSTAMRALRRREAELERTNTELTRTLADKERAIAALRSTAQDDFHDGVHDMDSLLREEAIAASTALRSERQKCEELGAKLEKAKADIFRQTALSEEQMTNIAAALRREEAQRIKLEELLSEKESTLQSLERRLKDQGQGAGPSQNRAHGEIVEERIKAMTDQLMKKQLALDEANCEKAALRARLGASATRISKLETEVQRYLSSPAATYADDEDIEEGGLRRRRKAPASISTLLLPVTESEGVSKAVDSADRFVLYAGRVLRGNPIARAIFLLYFVVLHLWTFTLIAFHTHVTLEP